MNGEAKTAPFVCHDVHEVARRFCYVVVRNAGHMTPAFAPRASYDMLTRFLNAKAFDKSAEGNNALKIPQCAQCGGAGPFAGKALPACASQQ